MAKANGGSKGELVLVGKEEYAITRADEAREAVQENLRGQTITAYDLDAVRMPAGGGTAWEVPTLDGSEESVKELAGVIVHFQDQRKYWEKDMEESGGSSPPDCYSDDGVTGRGSPGGKCNVCPLSEFKSAKDGRGQACRQVRVVYLARPGDLLPLVLNVPPTSLKNIKQYFLRLASRGIKFFEVETVIGLEKVKGDSGITYSRATFKGPRRLSKEDLASVRTYIDGIRPALDRSRPPRDGAAAG